MSQALPLVGYPDLESQVKAMEEDGYAYLPKVIEGEQLTELRAAMDRLTAVPESFDRHGTPENGNGFLNKHINNAFNRDTVFLQYLDLSPVIELAEAVHGEDCHVIGMTAWVTGPGRPDQGLHIDWLPIPLPADLFSKTHVLRCQFSSQRRTTIWMTSMKTSVQQNYSQTFRVAIFPDGDPTARQNGKGHQKRVFSATPVMWCFSEAKSGTAAQRTVVTRPVISYKCTTRSG